MSEYTESLRALADLIDREDLHDVTFHADGDTLSVFQNNWGNARADKKETARILKAFGGTWKKDAGDTTMAFKGKALGFKAVHVFVDRGAICERRVVGIEKVVVPAREATEERTEEREIVEWECGSLLAA